MAKSKDKSIFSIRLTELMKNKAVTRQDLAKELGITPQQVSNYANGTSLPDYRCLYKLAKFFNVSSDYLLGIDDDKMVELQNMLIRKANDELLDKIIEFCNSLKTKKHGN